MARLSANHVQVKYYKNRDVPRKLDYQVPNTYGVKKSLNFPELVFAILTIIIEKNK